MNAQDWISKLNLVQHPEGGYYREIYRSRDLMNAESVAVRYKGERSCSTAIYFLLKSGEPSRIHSVQSDELWHFYHGDPVTLYLFKEAQRVEELRLCGSNQFMVTIPANTWFGARSEGAAGYSLVGCTVAPGFEFQDFELARRKDMLNNYPSHADLIKQLTGESC